MRLLITTQAIDLGDPVLGFFHRWVEELARSCTDVHVICLREGRHALPSNVSVWSLGKEKGHSRLQYLLRFFQYAWRLRNEYEAVFVHMNPEYVLLAGLWWRLRHKRVVLWRNHKASGFITWLAAHIAHAVCYTSPSAYVARFRNAVQMPIGVDTRMFVPGKNPDPRRILFLGRLDSVKKPEVFLEAMTQLTDTNVQADVYGDPTSGREAYAAELRRRFADAKNVSFHAAVHNEETPALYQSHGIYVNLTSSGSFDKTIGEAMACGSIVVCANDALRSVLPEKLMAGDSPKKVARALHAALGLSADERTKLAQENRSYIERKHSLSLLVRRLVPLLAK